RRTNSAVIVDAGGDFRSNVLDNLFMKKMALGGTIGPDVKDNIAETLKDHNRAGGNAKFGATYYSFSPQVLGKEDWGWSLGVSQNFDYRLTFPRELYEVAFEGNAQFAGEEVRMTRVNAHFIDYQKLSLGLFDKNNFSRVSLSVLNGRSAFALDGGAALFTSELGDSLALRTAGTAMLTDPENTGSLASNGLGASIDAMINAPLGEGKSFIRFTVEDLGFMAWNQSTQNYLVNDTVIFTGVEVNDFSDGALGELQVPAFLDSLEVLDEAFSQVWAMKTKVGVSFVNESTEGHFLEFGVRVQSQGGIPPLVYGSYHYLIDKSTSIYARASIGGYGRLRIGAGVEKYWNHWYLSAQTGDLPGLILDDLRGRGAWFSVGRFFQKQ
ncbi:MAG: hypothetical protein HKN32_08375, partial [Flavobacteriales bacterium]|nr:hypothetical protein [Flavobacteriales bacterium]